MVDGFGTTCARSVCITHPSHCIYCCRQTQGCMHAKGPFCLAAAPCAAFRPAAPSKTTASWSSSPPTRPAGSSSRALHLRTHARHGRRLAGTRVLSIAHSDRSRPPALPSSDGSAALQFATVSWTDGRTASPLDQPPKPPSTSRKPTLRRRRRRRPTPPRLLRRRLRRH